MPDREEVGNKARGIAVMRSLGLPVPPAFVVPTTVGTRLGDGGELPEQLWAEIEKSLAELEAGTGRTFGSGPSPLLVSVRSGAAQSMPGMMDTILDLGMNDEVERALAAEAADPAFAADTHCRFVESYGRIVLKATPAAWPATAAEVRDLVREHTGSDVPTDPREQLRGAVQAVFESWNSPRAQAYRRHWKLSDSGGTAVTVQAMVFGNVGDDSGTGVFFTRNPESGAREPYGDFLRKGQGEDVGSGEADPLDLTALAALLPSVHTQLLEAGDRLERHFRDAQDIEFTVERARLYLLQTRSAKRSPEGALRLAVEMAREGLIAPTEALERIRPEHVEGKLKPRLDPAARAAAARLLVGEPACPGLASGRVVDDPDDAVERSEDEPVVLVRHLTSPEDLHGMIAAEGICTEVGGRTSHAAVVSRELGRPCIVGCGEGTLTGLVGQIVTIDGSTGEVFAGHVPTVRPDPMADPHLGQLVRWAAEHRDVLPTDHPLATLASAAS